MPFAAKNMTGTVVSSNSSMTRGLVRPTYAPTTSRKEAARAVESPEPAPAALEASACRAEAEWPT